MSDKGIAASAVQGAISSATVGVANASTKAISDVASKATSAVANVSNISGGVGDVASKSLSSISNTAITSFATKIASVQATALSAKIGDFNSKLQSVTANVTTGTKAEVEKLQSTAEKLQQDAKKAEEKSSTDNSTQNTTKKKTKEKWQFNRIYSLVVANQDGDGRIIEGKETATGLDMSFNIQKDTTKNANKSNIKIFNLADETLKFFESKDALCLFEVGYAEGEGLKRIFTGFVSGVKTTKQGADRETEITLEDGALPVRDTVVSLSYGHKVTRKKIIEDVAQSMGVSLRIAPDCEFGEDLPQYSYIGAPPNILTSMCSATDLVWSMQNGILQIIKAGGTLGLKQYAISPSTGLIGVPERIIKSSKQSENKTTTNSQKKKKTKTKKAGWKLACLLNPILTPGDFVKVESKEYTGECYIESLEHRGDYSGSEWYTEMQLVEIQKDEAEESETEESTSESSDSSSSSSSNSQTSSSDDSKAKTESEKKEEKNSIVDTVCGAVKTAATNAITSAATSAINGAINGVVSKIL